MDLIEQYTANVNPGPLHQPDAALLAEPPAEHRVRFLAYYLPQFHAVAENDEWWGTGFTEWTNVTKALPRYQGHFQPRLPAALGFYDLSDSEVLRRQAALARRAGVHGFCIHDYWFSGRRLLERPIENLLADPTIDLPFCVNWANESWTRTWDGRERDFLIEQLYSPEDDRRYADHLLRYVADRRYIRIDGRPLVMIYRPGALPDAAATVERWRARFREAGEADPFVVMPQAFGDDDPRAFGMDAAAGFPPHRSGFGTVRSDSPLPDVRSRLRLLDPRYYTPVRRYAAMAEREQATRSEEFTAFPGVCPSWDNEARKPGHGVGFVGATPARYGRWLYDAARWSAGRFAPDERLVFINAWNEWGEGAHLEPDRHYGHAWLVETRRVLDAVNAGVPYMPASTVRALHDPEPSEGNRWRNLARRQVRRLADRIRR